MTVQNLILQGKRFIVMDEAEYERLLSRAAGKNDRGLPRLPEPLEDGNYPAIEYARASVARDIIRARRRLGLTQAELARRAGVPVQALNQLEKAISTPSAATVRKIDRALRQAQTKRARPETGRSR